MADYAIHDTTLEAIADTIRKKDGTSALIDPADYADRINIMGMLEEKTVSGSIAHITDGADEVPLKKCEITLPASLDGYSEIDVIHAGKNLLDLSNIVNGDYTGTGAEFVNNVVAVSPMAIKGGANYIMTCSSSVSGFYFRFYDENNTEITEGRLSAYNVTSKTFSTPSNAVTYIPMWYNASGLTPADVVSKSYMIEAGSSATTYEPYTAPTQYTADLGRTIHGGTADVVNGTGTETYNGLDLSTLTWSGGIIGGQMWCWYCDISSTNPELPPNSSIFDGMSDNYTPIRFNGVSNTADTIAIRSNGVLYVNNGSDTVEPMGHVTYKLATPSTFTFTPITPTPETALGVNNFWADEWDTEVTYRSSGTVHQYPEGEEVYF